MEAMKKVVSLGGTAAATAVAMDAAASAGLASSTSPAFAAALQHAAAVLERGEELAGSCSVALLRAMARGGATDTRVV